MRFSILDPLHFPGSIILRTATILSPCLIPTTSPRPLPMKAWNSEGRCLGSPEVPRRLSWVVVFLKAADNRTPTWRMSKLFSRTISASETGPFVGDISLHLPECASVLSRRLSSLLASTFVSFSILSASTAGPSLGDQQGKGGDHPKLPQNVLFVLLMSERFL